MFRIGQKVVCVDTWPKDSWRDAWDRFWNPYKSPIKGAIYTLSNIYADDGIEYVELFELPSPQTTVWMAGFFACGFRPAVDRATDISIFTKMLITKKGRVHA